MKHANQAIFKKGLYGITVLILSFGPFISVSGDSGIFLGPITPPITGGPAGTPLSDLSPGQQFTQIKMGALCGPTNPIACSLGVNNGIDGNSALNLSPQAAMQAVTISVTSPYQFFAALMNVCNG